MSPKVWTVSFSSSLANRAKFSAVMLVSPGAVDSADAKAQTLRHLKSYHGIEASEGDLIA